MLNVSLARSVALQDAQPQLRQFLLLSVFGSLVVLDNLVDDIPRTLVLRPKRLDKSLDDLTKLTLA